MHRPYHFLDQGASPNSLARKDNRSVSRWPTCSGVSPSSRKTIPCGIGLPASSKRLAGSIGIRRRFGQQFDRRPRQIASRPARAPPHNETARAETANRAGRRRAKAARHRPRHAGRRIRPSSRLAISVHVPTFAAPRRPLVNQSTTHQRSAALHSDPLPLFISSPGKTTHRIGRNDQQGPVADRGRQCLTADSAARAFVNLGGRLRADDAGGLRTEPQLQIDFVAGDQSAAVGAGVNPGGRRQGGAAREVSMD